MQGALSGVGDYQAARLRDQLLPEVKAEIISKGVCENNNRYQEQFTSDDAAVVALDRVTKDLELRMHEREAVSVRCVSVVEDADILLRESESVVLELQTELIMEKREEALKRKLEKERAKGFMH